MRLADAFGVSEVDARAVIEQARQTREAMMKTAKQEKVAVTTLREVAMQFKQVDAALKRARRPKL